MAQKKPLLTGDTVSAGDQVIAEGGNILVQLTNGRIAEVTPGQMLDLGDDFVLNSLGLNSDGYAVAQLDSLIESLVDLPAPTADDPVDDVISQDPPAAGNPIPTDPPQAGSDSGSMGAAVLTEFGSSEVEVTFGYQTNVLAPSRFSFVNDIAGDQAFANNAPGITTGALTLNDQIREAELPAEPQILDFTIASLDGVSSVQFDAVDDLNSANYTSGGDDVEFELLDDGLTIIGKAGDFEVIRLELTTADDNLSGTVAATILGQFDHPEDSDTLNLNGLRLLVQDGDTDTVTADIAVTINDSLPEIDSPEQGTIAETVEGPSPVEGDLGINWGADNTDNDVPEASNDRSVRFAPELEGESNLTSGGSPISYQLVDGGTQLVASVGGQDSQSDPQTVFTVTLTDDGTGSYTFDLRGVLDHRDTDGNPIDSLDLTFGFIATDADTDQVTGEFTVSVNDSNPTGTGPEIQNPMYIVDDDDLENGNDGGIDDDDATVPPSSQVLEHSFGADGAGSHYLGRARRQ